MFSTLCPNDAGLIMNFKRGTRPTLSNTSPIRVTFCVVSFSDFLMSASVSFGKSDKCKVWTASSLSISYLLRLLRRSFVSSLRILASRHCSPLVFGE
jgi:hypothetical protein